MDHYHGNGQFPYFLLSPGKFKLSETQKVIEKRNIYIFSFSSQQYNYSKRNWIYRYHMIWRHFSNSVVLT